MYKMDLKRCASKAQRFFALLVKKYRKTNDIILNFL